MAGLAVWFVFARTLSHWTERVPALLSVATFAGVFGAVLAGLATPGTLAIDATRSSGAPRALLAARAVLAAPIAALVFASMFGEPPVALQWTALASAGLTLVLAASTAIVRRDTLTSARLTLLALLVGEGIELAYAPAQALLPPNGSGALAMAWLGRISELCALLGSAAAARWAWSAGVRSVGAERTKLFAPFVASIAAVLLALVTVVRTPAGAMLGRVVFGARFDLVSLDEHSAVSRPALFLYILAPIMVLASITLSGAGIGRDRGAGARRTLGWLAILFAGFGVLRIAGPMDPIRLALVALGAVLLERATDREARDAAREDGVV